MPSGYEIAAIGGFWALVTCLAAAMFGRLMNQRDLGAGPERMRGEKDTGT